MRPETEEALDELMSLFPLTEESAQSFEEALARVAVLEDPDVIPSLLDLADERCTVSGSMEALMESLEIFPAEEYVPRFLSALPGFVRRNPRLAQNAVSRMLWSCLDALTEMAPNLPAAVRRALRTVLLEIDTSTKERDQLLTLLSG